VSALELELQDIHVAYGDRAALHGISMTVKAGEMVALVGSNGAGKTTTLRAIMGLQRPFKGQVLFDGDRIDQLTTPEIVTRGLALSPEGRRVFPRMTVHDNLLMGGYLQSDAALLRRGVEHAFERFPRLSERRKQLAGLLSGGEQQMLAIGRALMARPKVLLLDEPSLGLAPIRVQEISRIIEQICREEGLAIVLVEQNARLALRLCDRAYVLESGRITLSGPGKELAESEYVQRAYLGV
jgi:branched-chain amino acid transport system ATP-binding protein